MLGFYFSVGSLVFSVGLVFDFSVCLGAQICCSKFVSRLFLKFFQCDGSLKSSLLLTSLQVLSLRQKEKSLYLVFPVFFLELLAGPLSKRRTRHSPVSQCVNELSLQLWIFLVLFHEISDLAEEFRMFLLVFSESNELLESILTHYDSSLC